MSGREIGTVVGAVVVGYLTAGTGLAAYGAAIGGVAGGLIGSAFDPKVNNQGPRLDDLKVMSSTYGAGIPTLYGTERFGGNVIWSTDKLEIAKTAGSGGKGGGGTNTSYSYYVHMAIALCETPRDGSQVRVLKMLQDGKLIYDASSGIPIGSALASAENPYSSLVLWQGDEAQLPDPIIESWLGVGKVPAYRGTVMVRMFAVACPAGRVPQFTFVLSSGATVGATHAELGRLPGTGGAQTRAAVSKDEAWQVEGLVLTTDRVLSISHCGPGYAVSEAPMTLQSTSGGRPPCFVDGANDPTVVRPWATGSVVGVDSKNYTIVNLRNRSEGLLWTTPLDSGTSFMQLKYVGYDGASYAISENFSDIQLVPEGTVLSLGASLSVAFYNATLYVVKYIALTLVLETYDKSGGLINSVSGPVGISSTPGVKLNVSGRGVFVVLTTPFAGVGFPIYKVIGGMWNLLCADSGIAPATRIDSIYCSDTYCMFGPERVTGADAGVKVAYSMVRFNATTTSAVKAKDIIADQCQRAGETRYDVSGIPDSDTVTGYKLASPASARANIDPLLTAFQIFIVDEDGLIKFKKYSGITSVATVSYDELGQAEDGSGPGDAMPLSRTQSIDLPRSVSASYIEPLLDYQTATETVQRMVTDAMADRQITLPMAISSSQARTAANAVLFAAWRSQNTRTLKVSRKFAFVSPGDGVTIEYPRGTLQLWRVTSINDTGALCEWTVEPGDASIYAQTAIGATGYAGQQVPPLAPTTRMQIIDGAILQDADDNAGPYVVLSGYAAPYPGGELLIGNDATSLLPIGAVSSEAVMGYAETAPGAWSSSSVDETNLVTISVDRFSLSAITRDVLLAGSSNIAAIGANGRWEYIAFQRADSLGSGRYVLSGLLRGLRGTEWASGLHQAGDAFVMLGAAGAQRPNLEVGTIGSSKLFRAVTLGRSTGTDQTYANTGEGLKPFSPVDLRKSVDAIGNITLTWDRRTRMSCNWLTGIMPLGERTERYDVVIYSSSAFTAIERVYSVYAPTAIYTAADQVTDFGSTQSTLYVRVYQLSDSIGRGHELQAIA